MLEDFWLVDGVCKCRTNGGLHFNKTAGTTNVVAPAAISGRQLIRSLRTDPRKGQVAMMLTGLLHALWPVLPPSALISIVYNLPGVVG